MFQIFSGLFSDKTCILSFFTTKAIKCAIGVRTHRNHAHPSLATGMGMVCSYGIYLKREYGIIMTSVSTDH